MRPWTERRAWLYLAGRWEKAKGAYPRPTLLGRTGGDGLCLSVGNLRGFGKIDAGVQRRMWDRLDGQARRIDSPYCWPLTKSGARSRAAFCRRMAKLCERERLT